jgi:hypothetical protein
MNERWLVGGSLARKATAITVKDEDHQGAVASRKLEQLSDDKPYNLHKA